MNIKNIDRDLYIIQVMEKNSDYEYIFCVDLLEEKNNQYDVLKVTNYSMICKIMPLLSSQLKNKKFSDFVDCFSQDNVFYAMFKHNDNTSLFDKLKNGEYTTIERLEIFKNLVKKIVMLNIPTPIQVDILYSKNITLLDTLDIDFKYSLHNIPNYSKFDFVFLQKVLKDILKIVLKKEFDDNISQKLNTYYANLCKGVFKEPIELYSEYIAVYEEIQDNLKKNNIVKKSKWLRIWEKIKNIIRLIKPFIVSLIVILALIYLIYVALGFDKKDNSQYDTYKSIGVLDIKEYQSNED